MLLVHGIWDSRARLEPLARGLRDRGVGEVLAFDLRPADGSATIPELARQIGEQVDALRERHACARVDLVGFSMGALASRYYLQRCGGRDRVRRFVSISGPHAGTWTAYGLPFAGVRQMRPGSELLRELAADEDPWGEVEVHCIYTRYDLMIRPPESSLLRGARATLCVDVPLHRWMIRDARVLDWVAAALTCSEAGPPAT